jgi:hypothetical protein
MARQRNGLSVQIVWFASFLLIQTDLFTCRRGNPWNDKSDDVIATRVQLLTLLDCFTSFGWELHASIGINIAMGGAEIDTWYFRRNT